MKLSKRKPGRRELASLNAERERHRITQQMVAAEAAKTARFGTCSLVTVSLVLSGKRVSANVIAALRRLIAEAKARKPGAPTANPQPTPEPRAKAG